MKTKTHNILSWALFAVMALLSAACSDDDAEITGTVIGAWKNTTEAYEEAGITSYVQFLDDGTFRKVTLNGDSLDIVESTWTMSGTVITVNESGDSSEVVLTVTTLTDNTLQFIVLGFNLSFTRVDEEEMEQYLP